MTSKVRDGLRMGPHLLFAVLVAGGVAGTCLFLLVQAWA